MSRTISAHGSRAFRGRYRLIQSTASLPTLFGVFGYMLLLTDLPVAEWATWWACLLVYGGVVGAISERRYWREIEPVARYLDGQDSDPGRAQLARTAFSALASLPIRMQRRGLVMNFLPALIFPVAMALFGHSGWLEWDRIRSYFVATLVGSLFSSGLTFYWIKRSFSDLCSELGHAVGDPAHRASLVERFSLVKKLRFAVTLPALASILLLCNVVYDSLRMAAEEAAVDWAQAALASVARADAELPVAARVEARLPDRDLWPNPMEIVEIAREESERSSLSTSSSLLSSALDHALEADLMRSGRLVPANGGEVGAFHRLDDGSILLAAIDRHGLQLALGHMNRAVFLVCIVMVGCALLMGHLVCQDLRNAFSRLRDEVDRMAAGDLRPGAVFESEDELGDLGRAFEMMGQSLRDTIGRVSAATDRVERTAGDVSVVVASLASESRDQFGRIRVANELMLSINAQAQEVSQSARELNATIEESGASVLELGTAGDGLNETAAILSSKVEEVSESIEQMVRSVKEVAVTTEGLSHASEETSSSMEEMASAMRAVDSSAETTANLSRVVVEKAELGQARVSQTIVGMDAIREATDAAERVIRGLGARTGEIGGILDVIDNVAEETNLLALNAAIIAAQAGEQGRAFSVVADEIKDLADRVLASTKEISGLILAVQDESENAIGAIEAGSNSVMSGVDLSAEAGRTLEEITDASRESGTRIAEIVSSVQEQTRAASHVVNLMERVRDAAERIAAAGQDQGRSHEVVYRSALTMREVAQQVRTTTEEQSRGFRRIRENVEGVRRTVEQINGSLQEQSQACGEVARFLESVFEGTRTNEEAAGRMGVAMQELLSQAESLRSDVESFRIS